jgi:hypothetical protein
LAVVYTFRIVHEDGTPFNLTGYTVGLLVATQASRSCTVTDATGGIATYTSAAAENTGDTAWLASKSPLKAQLSLTKSTTNLYYTRLVELEVVSV